MATPLESQWTRDGLITERILDFVTFEEFIRIVEAGGFSPRVQKAVNDFLANIYSLTLVENIVQNANRAIGLMTRDISDKEQYRRHLARARGMKLLIQLQDGNGEEVIVEADWTVLRLKSLLAQKTKIDRGYQRLFFASRELNDSKTLRAQNLGDGNTLSMRVVRESDFVIFVKGTERDLITIQGLRPESTVGELLAKVEERLGKRDAYLTYGGHRLEEYQTLRHYNIESEATVHYQQRLRGG